MMSPSAKMLENLGVEASIRKANQEACGVGEAEIWDTDDRIFRGLLINIMVIISQCCHHDHDGVFVVSGWRIKMKINV